MLMPIQIKGGHFFMLDEHRKTVISSLLSVLYEMDLEEKTVMEIYDRFNWELDSRTGIDVINDFQKVWMETTTERLQEEWEQKKQAEQEAKVKA